MSLEAGNSPQMIFQHYREVVTEKEAKAWFAVAPGGKREAASGKRGIQRTVDGGRWTAKKPKPGNVIELAAAVA